MRWNELKNQRGGLLEKILIAALLAFAIFAAYKYFSNPDNQNPKRAYQHPLAD